MPRDHMEKINRDKMGRVGANERRSAFTVKCTIYHTHISPADIRSQHSRDNTGPRGPEKAYPRLVINMQHMITTGGGRWDKKGEIGVYNLTKGTEILTWGLCKFWKSRTGKDPTVTPISSHPFPNRIT